MLNIRNSSLALAGFIVAYLFFHVYFNKSADTALGSLDAPFDVTPYLAFGKSKQVSCIDYCLT